MKTTGILRRIDDLGRIVIPKEIRKRLKIQCGDSLDIFVDENSIILSKFHPLNHDSSLIASFCDSLKEIYTSDIIITDNQRIIYNTIDEELNYLELEDSFKKRINSYIDKEISGLNKVNLTKEYVLDRTALIYEIVTFDKHFGYLLILDDIISKKQKDLALFILNYLNKILL